MIIDTNCYIWCYKMAHILLIGLPIAIPPLPLDIFRLFTLAPLPDAVCPSAKLQELIFLFLSCVDSAVLSSWCPASSDKCFRCNRILYVPAMGFRGSPTSTLSSHVGTPIISILCNTSLSGVLSDPLSKDTSRALRLPSPDTSGPLLSTTPWSRVNLGRWLLEFVFLPRFFLEGLSSMAVLLVLSHMLLNTSSITNLSSVFNVSRPVINSWQTGVSPPGMSNFPAWIFAFSWGIVSPRKGMVPLSM